MKGNIDLSKKPQFFQFKNLWLGISLLLFAVVVFSISYLCLEKDRPVMLLVDGQPLVVAAGKEEVDKALDRAESELEKQYGTVIKGFKQALTFDSELVKKEDKPVSGSELCELLKDRLDWQAECAVLSISGKPDLYLRSENEAKKALEEIKKYYLPGDLTGVEVERTDFAEEVSLRAGTGPVKSVRTAESAVEAMVKGLDRIIQHSVQKGESLWTIARDNNMTVAQLMEMNPEQKSDFLRPGQKLNLVKAEPLLTVLTTVTTTVEEKIPYKTVYEDDDTLWRGQQKVRREGVPGSRKVTYRISKANDVEVSRETLEETILSEPLSRIVLSGTKMMIASRGDGGNGILGWPTRGKINSPFGKKRGRKIHSGTDIDGEIGDPIFAAGDGVVLEAGWKGRYGKCVMIDHGRGLTTLYGHLSLIDVAVGQQVSRGDIIGLLGTTGNSTGPHLHFEVRLNGEFQNPMKYLEQ
ncbi:MAG: M23 family metallopeptidase [Peptococcaceae bacterium]|nr:M23 family metallopeptidase [Peptococcaceae bacterium]MDH7523773.1 M23 family metallopeptidase [Peptococcaceae bacterium]